MPNDDLVAKRQAAQLAMEGEDFKARREKNELATAKMRELAALAMEGNDRKAAREAKDKAEQQTLAAEQKRLADIEQIRQMEADRLKQAKEKAVAEQTKTTEVKETRIEKIHQAEAVIETLKQAPTGLSSVRTLQSDLNQAVERRKLSATSIAIEGQNQPKIIITEHPKKGGGKAILTTLLILILIGAGGGALWYGYQLKQLVNMPLVGANLPKMLLAENPAEVLLDASALSGNIRQDIQSRLSTTATGVTALYFSSQTTDPDDAEKIIKTWLTPEKFATISGVAIPTGLLRTFDNLFTIGTIVKTEAPTAPFVVWQIKDQPLALARMFIWEETILTDLAALWPTNQTTNIIPTNTSFTDKRLNNLDARILYRTDQSQALVYAFFNNKYLIITTTETALTDLVNRLAP